MDTITSHSLQSLQTLYDELNETCFEGVLPPCHIAWSRQLTRTAGNIDVRRRIIKLSVPLLGDAFQSDSLFAAEYSVCGVLCASRESALREILKHEMIHLWLHERGLPSGHTAEFRAKARAIGQTKIRHDITLPAPRTGWIYTCPLCKSEFARRRRYSRPVACMHCCKRFNGGKYHERFKLRGRRIAPAVERQQKPG
jgi:ribosomal protein L37AE/L43A